MLGSSAFRMSVTPGGALAGPWVKNPLWSTARAVPSLDQPFADTKSLVDAVTGQSLVTFTRASSGTYVDSTGTIQTASTDVPRFDHNPTTLESLGLLVEEQRTNNLVQSEDFSTTWTTTNLTVTTNSVVAPDGTTTADTIAPPTDGLTTTRYLRQNPALTTQGAYTFSVFVKVGTATTGGIALYVSDSTATNNFRSNFNLFTLTAGGTGTGWATPTTAIIPYPNGWYRCVLSGVTSTAHTSLRANIYLSTFGNVADSYGSIHVWGAQLEAAAFPTSYIPTTTATATRSADVASIAGTNFSSWYNQSEGAMFAEATVPAVSLSIFAFSDGTANERIVHDTGTNQKRLVVSDGGISQAQITRSYTFGTTTKAAIAIATNSMNLADSGALGTEDTSGTLPTVDRLNIGANATGGSILNGTIRRLTYWPARLPNSTLAAITQ